MANITVIPASKTLHSKMPLNAQSRRKVAGYARVSTDSEEQLTSYEAQVDYYTQYIRSKSGLGVRGCVHGRRNLRNKHPAAETASTA